MEMKTQVADSSTRRASNPAAGKYLTFTVGTEEYGVPVLQVREILKTLEITTLPQVPSHVRGVINLRGKVIPIVHLASKFGVQGSDDTERSSIVVVDVTLPGERLLLGMLVDAVSEVLTIADADIEPPPSFGSGVSTDYLRGLAKSRTKVRLLLDLSRVFADGAGIAAALPSDLGVTH